MTNEATRARLVLVLPLALAVLAPSPWSALDLTARPAGTDPTAPLLAAVALLAWACSGWLVALVLCTWAGRLPGPAGAAARRSLRRLAPASVRGLLRLAVGASVAASVLTGPAALAQDRAPAPVGSLDWPGSSTPAVRSTAPAVPSTAPADHPRARPVGPTAPASTSSTRSSTTPPAASPAARVGAAAGSPTAVGPPRAAASSPAPTEGPAPDVVVQEGDSLWTIAARELGPGAAAARVAQAWPRWWQANREVVGDDPDLIHPGARLTPPPTR